MKSSNVNKIYKTNYNVMLNTYILYIYTYEHLRKINQHNK